MEEVVFVLGTWAVLASTNALNLLFGNGFPTCKLLLDDVAAARVRLVGRVVDYIIIPLPYSLQEAAVRIPTEVSLNKPVYMIHRYVPNFLKALCG